MEDTTPGVPTDPLTKLNLISKVSRVIRQWLADNVSPDVGMDMKILFGGHINKHNAKKLMYDYNYDGLFLDISELKPEI